MANVLGLALRITGDASGLRLDPAERALQRLGAEAEKTGRQFDQFTEDSEGAARAQQQAAAAFEALNRQLRDRAISANDFARAFGELTAQTKETVAAFQEGLQITRRSETAEESRARQLDRLRQLLDLGAISATTFGREVAGLTDGFNGAQADRFGEAVAGLTRDLQGGRLTVEEFARASSAIASAVESATPSAQRQAEAILALRQQYDDGRISVERYREEFAKIQQGDIRSTFAVDVLGVREGIDATEQLQATLERLTNTQIEAALEVSGVETLDEIRQQFAGIDGTQVDALLSVLGVESIDAARERLAELDGLTSTATVDLAGVEQTRQTLSQLEQAFGSLESAQARLESLPDVDLQATFSLLGVDSIDEARQRLEALGALQIEPQLQTIGFESIDDARAALESLQDRSVSATLEFFGAESIEDVRERLATLDGTTVEAQAFLQASGFDSIEQAQAQLAELRDVDVTATLNLLGAESIDDAQARLTALSSIDVSSVFTLLGVDTIEDAQQRLRDVSDTEVIARLQAVGIESVEQAREIVASLESTSIEVVAETLGIDSVQQLLDVVNAVESKTIEVVAESNVDEAARQVADLVAEQERFTALQERAAELSRSLVTAEQERAESARELLQLREAGVLGETEYAALLARIGPISEEARQAEAALAADRDRARQIIESLITPQQEYQNSVAELDRLLRQGQLDQEQYNQALQQAQQTFEGTADAAERSGLAFNELSGVFAILPGPLGNIAGRLSGITSAGQGLSRVFSGGLSQGLSQITTQFAGLATPANLAAAAVVGVGAAATAVVNGLTALEDRVERLGNLANQLGVSFGFVQDIEESGRRSGVSVQQLESSFARLQNTLAAGGEESRRTTEALGRLGIAASELADLSQEDQIRLFGERIAAIEDPAERSAAAIALFGRSGVQLLPFFNNLAQAAIDVERFNARLSDIDRTRIDELGTAFDGVAVAARGLGQEVLTPFLGVTRSISEGLSPAITTLGQTFGAVFDAISPVTSALGLLGNFALQVTATVGRLVTVALEPAAAIGRTLSGVYDIVSQTFTTAFSAVNRVTDAFRDFFRFEGVASALSSTLTRIGTTISDTLAPVFERLSAIGQRVGVIITAVFERLGSFFASFANSTVSRIGEVVAAFLRVTGITDAVSAAAERIGQVFGSAWEIIQGVVSTIGGLIEDVLQFAEDWLGITETIAEPVEATIEVDTGDTIAELIAENKELGKVIDGITKSVSDAINESAQFGQAGFDAALRYQDGIADLKEDLAAGLFNEETFRIEAEKARVAFQSELDRISEDARLEIQIEQNASRVLDGLRQQINEVVSDSARLGQAGFDAALDYQSAIERLQDQFEQGILNETALAEEAKRAREEYDLQVAAIEQATTAQRQQIENDQRRIESLLQVNTTAQRITDDIASVDREITRVQEEFARAIDEFDGAAAINAQRRIEELGQLQQRLSGDLQAAAAGFEQGFDAAFAQTGENFTRLAEQAAEFGEAGLAAAARLQEGIAAAQEQARDGILNRDAFEAEVARQQRLFEQELQNVRTIAEERQRVNELVDQRFLLARFGGDQQRLQAAQNLAELEREIGRVQAEVQAARLAGEQDAVNAGIIRLGQLDQVAAQERDIASGRRQLEEQIAEQRNTYLEQLQQQQQAAQQQQEAFLEEQRKAVEAEQQRQAARIRELNTLGAGVIQGTDVRTSEGAALFLQLAANRQDPALIEARLQTRRLTEVRDGILRLVRQSGQTIVQIGAGVG